MGIQESERPEAASLHYNLLALWPTAIHWSILLKNCLKCLQSKKEWESYTHILLNIRLWAMKFKQTNEIKNEELNSTHKSKEVTILL